MKVLFDYIVEASGLDPASVGRIAVIDAAAEKIGADRTTIYQWLSKGVVPKSESLVKLVVAVNEVRFLSDQSPCTLDEISEIAMGAP